MRTTIDLPDDLHQLARDIAHRRRVTMSAVVVDLMRRGLSAPLASDRPDPRINMEKGRPPLVSVGRPITAEDVRTADDDEDEDRDAEKEASV